MSNLDAVADALRNQRPMTLFRASGRAGLSYRATFYAMYRLAIRGRVESTRPDGVTLWALMPDDPNP